MADPRLYLPPALSDESIQKLISQVSLPEPTTIRPLVTTAAYHTIYLATFAREDVEALAPVQSTEHDGSVSLVLRVSGKHIPRIKTLNEVAAMKWVREYTSIPVPAVVRFDSSENNAIGHEYTLLEKIPGVSIDTIYDTLDDAKIQHLVSQLRKHLSELHRHEWNHAGGLSINETNAVVPGRILAENFWQGPEIAQFWGSDDSVDTLNIHGPFDTYTAYIEGHIRQYIRNIEKHESLSWMRDFIPRLQTFMSWMDERAGDLNDTRYILTQRDLHFGNIMCDPVTLQITAILDWEFAVVLPLPLWTPGGGFLWNAKDGQEALDERDRLTKDIFIPLCKEEDPQMLADFQLKDQTPHKEILRVLNFVRAIVEVCPRGQKLDSARSWRTTAEAALAELCIS